MTATLRHPNGVTLPYVPGSGFKAATPKPKPVLQTPRDAEKQNRALSVLTHTWQDLREISRQAVMTETQARSALNVLIERGMVKAQWSKNKMTRRRVYMLREAKG